MHAYLVVSSDPKEAEKKAKELAGKSLLLKFEILKIEDARDLIKSISLKVTQKTNIFIANIDKASPEAQNTLLKSLEEPQENLIYILTAGSAEAVLPTIVSRCELISIYPAKQDPALQGNLQRQVQEFLKLSVGKKLAITSKIKDREQAVEFVKTMIEGGHWLMIADPQIYMFVENAQKTLNALNANGNIQLQLTNFVVNI